MGLGGSTRWGFPKRHSRPGLLAYNKRHRAAKAAEGRCINEHVRMHAAPITNPKTGKPYSKCEECRAAHSGKKANV